MIVRISSLALLICASPALAQDLDPSVENADTDGDRYLSRQGWFPLKDGSVLRISQKSYDEGVTWEDRFRQRLVRELP